MEMKEKSDKEKLVALLNDPKLTVLENRLKREVNVFDILRIAETEIRHSNMLGWLLDPNQSHGFGSYVLGEFCKEIIGEQSLRDITLKEFRVYREWRNIDLLLVDEKDKIVICIENKINAAEGGTQLTRYHNIVEKEYPDFKKYYRFLTIDGHESSQPEIWQSLSHEFTVNVLRSALKIHEFSLSNRSETIIRQYLSILERKVIGMDEETQKLVEDIYKKHKDALDLIIENTSEDLTRLTSMAIKDWLETNMPENLYIDKTKTINSYIRIHSQYLDKLFPNGKNSSWGNGSKYYYEINCSKNGTATVKLVFSLNALSEQEKQLVDTLFERGNSRSRSTSEKWKTVEVFMKRTEAVSEPDYKLLPEIEKKLEKVFIEEIPAYEAKIASEND